MPVAPAQDCDGGACTPAAGVPAAGDASVDGAPYPSACPGGVVRFWDLATEPRALDYSPDGTRIAVGTQDGTVAVYQVSDGREIGHHNKHRQRIEAVRYSPDGRAVAAASDDGTLTHWAVGTEPRVWVHGAVVYAVAFAADGGVMLVGTQVGLHLVKTIAPPPIVPHVDGEAFRAVAYLPGGVEVVGATGNKILRFRAADLMPVGTATTTAEPVTTLAVPSTGAGVIAYGQGARLFLGLAAGAPTMYAQHRDPIEDLRYSRDGTRLLTTGADATKIWTVATWSVQRSLNGASSTAAFSPDGKQLVRVGGHRVLLHCID